MSHFSSQSRYYSFEIPGLLHVAAIDTDAYALPDYTTQGNGESSFSLPPKRENAVTNTTFILLPFQT